MTEALATKTCTPCRGGIPPPSGSLQTFGAFSASAGLPREQQAKIGADVGGAIDAIGGFRQPELPASISASDDEEIQVGVIAGAAGKLDLGSADASATP
jgi:hypothetical protein